MLRKLLLSGVKLDSSHLLEARNSKVEPFPKMNALIQAGIDPNGFVGPKRLKLLNFAILNRDEGLFNFLISKGVGTFIADRNGLLPAEAARIVEERGFEKVLGPFLEDPKHLLSLIESLLINPSALHSELHELLKWCVRNSDFELVRVTQPQNGLLRYRIKKGDLELRIELRFIYKESAETEITLLLFMGEAIIPVQSLLPLTGKIDSTSLRGYVVTELVGWANNASRSHKEKAKPPLKERSHWSAEDKDLELLGLRPGASEKDIIAAYRALAKRYHPDVSPQSGTEMIAINRAYGKLRGK